MVTLIFGADINFSSDINFTSYLVFLFMEIVSEMIIDGNHAFPAYFPCVWSAYNHPWYDRFYFWSKLISEIGT